MITSTNTITLHPIEQSLYYRKDVHLLLAQCEDCVLFTSVEEAIAKYCYIDYYHLFIAKINDQIVGVIGVAEGCSTKEDIDFVELILSGD